MGTGKAMNAVEKSFDGNQVPRVLGGLRSESEPRAGRADDTSTAATMGSDLDDDRHAVSEHFTAHPVTRHVAKKNRGEGRVPQHRSGRHRR